MQSQSTFWDPIRFVKTLAFFGEVPLMGNVRWVQQLLGGSPNPAAPGEPLLPLPDEIALVGADLAEQAALQEALNQISLSTVLGILPERIVNLRGIVWCGAEEDASAFAALVEPLKAQSASQDLTLFDFSATQGAELEALWGAVDDGVMGGVSASGIYWLPGFARFGGQVSTANAGGFASVRTQNFEPAFDLRHWQGIRLRLRGDGQRYKLILRSSSGWDSMAYCASFDTEHDTWMGVDVPFSAMRAAFRARTVSTAPPLDSHQVCSFQLMLSKFEYDGGLNPHFRPGAFALDVERMGVYRPVPAPPLIAIAPSPNQGAIYEQILSLSGLRHHILDATVVGSSPEALAAAISAVLPKG